MSKIFHNMKLYEEGVTDGIEQGKQLLLLQLLNKKLGFISEKYINIICELESSTIINIALSIFEINKIEDLDKYII